MISSCLVLSAVGKCMEFTTFRRSLERRLRSTRRALWFGVVVLCLEASVAITLWTPVRALGALLALSFLISASVWLVVGQNARRDVYLPSCECFGVQLAFPMSRPIASVMKPAWWALRNGTIAGFSLQVLTPSLTLSQALALGVSTVSVASLASMTSVVYSVRRHL